jgi:hypothetical protein
MNGSCDKQLVAAMDRPLVVAADKAALYVAAQDTKVYVIDKEQDGGFGIPVPLLTIGAYTLDLRSFPGGVGIAHTNGASLVYRDGGFATVNGYEGVYGCAVHASSFHWTTCYGSSTVKRSLLDGGGVQTLATDVGSSDLKTGAQALVVDNDNAYWTNTATRLVMQVSLDGGAPQAVSPMAVSRAEQSSFRLTKVGDYLIWTEGSTTPTSKDGRIVRAAAIPDASPMVLAANQGDPQFIVDDGMYVYWTSFDTGTVNRIKADGTEPLPVIIANAPSAFGIAIDENFVFSRKQFRKRREEEFTGLPGDGSNHPPSPSA